MITGITIENFKGIRERVKLDFRPITLLFGANSAGKSTILHALHYAREVFERHNLDAESHEEKRTRLGTREESRSMRLSILGAKFVKNARPSLRSGSITSETKAFEETCC